MDLQNRMFFVLSGKTWQKRIVDHEVKRTITIKEGQKTLRKMVGNNKAALSSKGIFWLPKGVTPEVPCKHVSDGHNGSFWRPKLNTKAGKDLKKALDSIPQPPDVHDFLKAHLPDWQGEGFTDSHYLRPTMGPLGDKFVLVLFDSEKNRKLTPPAGMKQIPGSQFLKLYEDQQRK